jgi:adenylosuccinate lyase
MDGLLETFIAILDGFGAFPAVIGAEVERYLPFLATTKVLMEAVRRGVGRETAHEVIKEHAVAVALHMREHGESVNPLLERLGSDSRLGISTADLHGLLAEPLAFTGNAAHQVRSVCDRIEAIVNANPDAAGYGGGDIL